MSLNERIEEVRNEAATLGGLCDLQVNRLMETYRNLWLPKITDLSISPQEIAAELLFTWANKIALSSGIAYQACLFTKASGVIQNASQSTRA